jgi:two-component system sensor histidine kinase/response regulator
MKSIDHSKSFLESQAPFCPPNGNGSRPKALAELDQLVALASLATNTSGAVLMRLQDDQFVLEAAFGRPPENQTAYSALYRHTMERRALVTFDDLTLDPDWKSHPLASESNGLRRYGGTPIIDSEGSTLGILAVHDPEPGIFSAESRQSLLHLSSLASRVFEAARMEVKLNATEAELDHAREAYNKSEAFYHSLVESLPQNILRKDLDGRFTFANQNFCSVLGKPLEEIIGKTDFDFSSSELATKYQNDDRQVAETGKRFETIEENQTATLEQNYVHVVKTPIYDRHGQIVGIQGIFWDVTEQRKTEKDLAFERDLLRSLLDSIPDHVYFKDQSSRFIVCSKELSDRLGLDSPEDAVGQRIINTGKPVIGKIEKEILKDGSENWVLTSKMPFRSGTGSIIGTFGVSKDVTSLVQTRQELEQAQKKYRDIFQQAVEGIFQTSPSGRFIEVNPALARIYGYESAQALLNQVTDIGKQLYVDQRRRRHFQQLMDRRGEVHDYESEIFRQDGKKIWIAETGRVVKDEDGTIKYYEGIVEDISERKRAESALQMARDVALESTRLKSIFLANMSHEIRTPMNGIIGMAGLLRRTTLDEEQGHFAVTIEESGLTLLRLINDILDFSKMESGKMTLEKAEFEPSTIVESVAELLNENAQRKGIELIIWIDPNIPQQVIGDATRLRQVLNNLVGNAIKFTSEGEVQILVKPIRTQGNRYRLKFEVQDTGIGIPQEAKRHIFEAFTQADESTTRKFGGTGLGLAISKQLIELMGGKLQVESEANKGSNFWFSLPFERSSSTSIVSHTPNKYFNGARALIVDGNRTEGDIIHKTLRPEGIHCTIVHSSSRARQVIEETQSKGTPFDYLIVDLNVSGNRGLKLCSTIRSTPGGRQIKKILMSPVGKKTPSRRLAECDIACVITKPIRRTQLLNGLERARLGEKAGSNSALGLQPPETTPRETKSLNGTKILVVEDNLVNQSVALHVLKQLGYEGIAANNGLEAIAMLNQAHFPLIFMDCQMPELDGYETTKKIREMEAAAKEEGKPRIRIIAMTANAMEGDRQRCLDAGMDDYISKPIMLPHIEAVLAGLKMPDSASSGNRDNETIPRLDPAVLANFNKLNPEDPYDPLTDLAELFGEEIPKQTKGLEDALAQENSKIFSRIAHTFKGSANNIGARKLAELCHRLEHWESELKGSSNEIRSILEEIQTEADAVLESLADIVAKRHTGS